MIRLLRGALVCALSVACAGGSKNESVTAETGPSHADIVDAAGSTAVTGDTASHGPDAVAGFSAVDAAPPDTDTDAAPSSRGEDISCVGYCAQVDLVCPQGPDAQCCNVLECDSVRGLELAAWDPRGPRLGHTWLPFGARLGQGAQPQGGHLRAAWPDGCRRLRGPVRRVPQWCMNGAS